MTALLTTEEAAARLRRSPRFVRDELKRSNLRGALVGREWLISEADLDAYLTAHLNVSREDRRRRRRVA